MSLFKFKCKECGHDISKIRPAKDIIFDFEKKKPVICKHCGCKYKMSTLVSWIDDLLTSVVFLIICFFTAFFVSHWLVTKINVIFEIRIDGLYYVLAALVLFLSTLLVGTHFISSMFPLKKIENEE